MAGYTLHDLISINYDPWDIKRAFKDEIEQNPGILSSLKPNDFTSFIRDLQKLGYNANDFRDGGYDPLSLSGYYSLSSLREAGYTDDELKKSGFGAWNFP